MDRRDIFKQWEGIIMGLLVFSAFTADAVGNIKEQSGGYIGSFDALMDCFTGEVVRSLVFAVIGFCGLVYSVYVLVRHYRGNSTDVWDTEEYDIAEEDNIASVSKGSLSYVLNQGNLSVQFMVPGDYTWNKKEKPDVNEDLGMVMFPRFTREDGRIVDCQLHVGTIEDVESGDYIDAEEDVQDHFEYLSEKQQKSVKIRQTVVGGKYIAHYFVTKEKSGFDKMQRLYAVCDLDKGKYFTLEMWCMSWEPELDIEDFAGFFEFGV